MSRRESDGRPVSPGLSASPPTPIGLGAANASAGQRAGHGATSGDAPLASSGIQRPIAGAQPPTPSQRSFGVHNILNPSESHASSTAADRPPSAAHTSPTRRQSEVRRPASQSWALEAQGGVGMPAETSLTPRGSPSMSVAAAGGSPIAHHSYPALGVPPRRYLTPRSPRAVSMSHASSFRAANASQPNFQQNLESQGHPSHQGGGGGGSGGGGTELSPGSTTSQPHGSPYGTPGAAMSRLAPYSTPPRSVSQPATAFGSHHQGPPIPPQHHAGQPPPMTHSPSPYTTGLPPSNRGFPPPLSEGRFGGPRSEQGPPSEAPATPVSTGQPLFSINPVHGENILVPVEMYQGSKEANEKRLRNAGASARFRARKKDKEAHKDISLQRLESTNRDLARRIQELEEERNHYRADRDRLREIVYRTPSISEHAYGAPPTPPRGSLVDSYSAAGSMTPTPLTPIAPQPALPVAPEGGPYAVDERPARRSASEALGDHRDVRRRRTESAQIEFTMPTYQASTTPGPGSGLPPVPPSPPVYSTMSHPGTPSAVSRTSMLPPLRMEPPPGQHPQGPPPQHLPPPQHQQHQQQPQQQPPPPQQHVHQFQQSHMADPGAAGPPHHTPHFRREPTYESGWATGTPPPKR